MRLVKGMYGSEFKAGSRLFGLMCGQMRSRGGFGHNSGWYNHKGEKIGWGDLGAHDVLNIQDGLEDDEVFITMSEQDSFWEFVEKVGCIGALAVVNEKEAEPGLEYMFDHTYFIITKNTVYRCDKYSGNDYERDGVQVNCIERDEVKRLILSYFKKVD